MKKLAPISIAALLVCATVPAQAQNWPDKQPIRLIVPAGPGGPNDVLARIKINPVKLHEAQFWIKT